MVGLSYDQKKTLVAYEHFFGNRYRTSSKESGNTDMHVETQKMCYLLKIAGVDIGDFDYSWNFKGPFSPGLLVLLRTMDRDGTAVSTFYEDSSKEEFLLDCADKVDNLRKVLEIDKHQDKLVQWVEILGSLVYISRAILPGTDFEEVNQRFVAEKSEYCHKETNLHAWTLLNKANLLSTTTAH